MSNRRSIEQLKKPKNPRMKKPKILDHLAISPLEELKTKVA